MEFNVSKLLLMEFLFNKILIWVIFIHEMCLTIYKNDFFFYRKRTL